MVRSVSRFYNQNPKMEWERTFSSPYRRLEYDTTLLFLEKYLPKKGTVLDAGAGPGRYSVELAKRGYDVVLVDLAEDTLRFAEGQVKGCRVR